MVNKTSNKSLHDANRAKNDEFLYANSPPLLKTNWDTTNNTLKGRLFFEIAMYPTEINFWEYFKLNFKFLGC